jgi:hypothetical protein
MRETAVKPFFVARGFIEGCVLGRGDYVPEETFIEH